MRGRAGRGAGLVASGVAAAGPLPLHHYQPGSGLAGPAAANFLPARPVPRRPPARTSLGLCFPAASQLGGARPAAFLQQTLLAAEY